MGGPRRHFIQLGTFEQTTGTGVHCSLGCEAKRNARRRASTTVELLNWHAGKLDLEETYIGNGQINAQRGIQISDKKECKNWD